MAGSEQIPSSDNDQRLMSRRQFLKGVLDASKGVVATQAGALPVVGDIADRIASEEDAAAEFQQRPPSEHALIPEYVTNISTYIFDPGFVYACDYPHDFDPDTYPNVEQATVVMPVREDLLRITPEVSVQFVDKIIKQVDIPVESRVEFQLRLQSMFEVAAQTVQTLRESGLNRLGRTTRETFQYHLLNEVIKLRYRLTQADYSVNLTDTEKIVLKGLLNTSPTREEISNRILTSNDNSQVYFALERPSPDTLKISSSETLKTFLASDNNQKVANYAYEFFSQDPSNLDARLVTINSGIDRDAWMKNYLQDEFEPSMLKQAKVAKELLDTGEIPQLLVHEFLDPTLPRQELQPEVAVMVRNFLESLFQSRGNSIYFDQDNKFVTDRLKPMLDLFLNRTPQLDQFFIAFQSNSGVSYPDNFEFNYDPAKLAVMLLGMVVESADKLYKEDPHLSDPNQVRVLGSKMLKEVTVQLFPGYDINASESPFVQDPRLFKYYWEQFKDLGNHFQRLVPVKLMPGSGGNRSSSVNLGISDTPAAAAVHEIYHEFDYYHSINNVAKGVNTLDILTAFSWRLQLLNSQLAEASSVEVAASAMGFPEETPGDNGLNTIKIGELEDINDRFNVIESGGFWTLRKNSVQADTEDAAIAIDTLGIHRCLRDLYYIVSREAQQARSDLAQLDPTLQDRMFKLARAFTNKGLHHTLGPAQAEYLVSVVAYGLDEQQSAVDYTVFDVPVVLPRVVDAVSGSSTMPVEIHGTDTEARASAVNYQEIQAGVVYLLAAGCLTDPNDDIIAADVLSGGGTDTGKQKLIESAVKRMLVDGNNGYSAPELMTLAFNIRLLGMLDPNNSDYLTRQMDEVADYYAEKSNIRLSVIYPFAHAYKHFGTVGVKQLSKQILSTIGLGEKVSAKILARALARVHSRLKGEVISQRANVLLMPWDTAAIDFSEAQRIPTMLGNSIRDLTPAQVERINSAAENMEQTFAETIAWLEQLGS